MSEDAHAPTIVICQCCEDQFNPEVEACRQDIDIGYVCADCFVQLKWSSAHLKVNGMPRCSKGFNDRIKNEF